MNLEPAATVIIMLLTTTEKTYVLLQHHKLALNFDRIEAKAFNKSYFFLLFRLDLKTVKTSWTDLVRIFMNLFLKLNIFQLLLNGVVYLILSLTLLI
jgi:hypothetical protein